MAWCIVLFYKKNTRFALWSPDLNKMIRNLRSVVLIWIMILEPSFQIGTSDRESFNQAALKFRSKSKDSWIKWFTICTLKS